MRPLDPLTIALLVIGLAAVAGIASYLPARRALRIEPMMALHLEEASVFDLTEQFGGVVTRRASQAARHNALNG